MYFLLCTILLTILGFIAIPENVEIESFLSKVRGNWNNQGTFFNIDPSLRKQIVIPHSIIITLCMSFST